MFVYFIDFVIKYLYQFFIKEILFVVKIHNINISIKPKNE